MKAYVIPAELCERILAALFDEGADEQLQLAITLDALMELQGKTK